MRRLFHIDAFRAPQLAASFLLLAYLLQCAWLVRLQNLQEGPPDSEHLLRAYLGLEQWKNGVVAGTPQSLRAEAATGLPSAAWSGHLRVSDGYDEDRSPLCYLVAAAPFIAHGSWSSKPPGSWQSLLAASPYLLFGLLLGASLWYVTRRLYGNRGGYIALTLYCFSPAILLNSAGAENLNEIGAVGGAFGIVFTGIAVAHTLYAPREVVLWNWRRILLLGLSVALAVGNQFSLAILAPLIVPVMYWVAPVRPRSLLAIWTAAMGVALVLLFAAYLFEPALFWQGMLHARWLNLESAAFASPISYRSALRTIFAGSPALTIALPVALVGYLGWKRTRYFGNTAPLFTALLLLILAMSAPSLPGQGFGLAMLVFIFVFVSGIFADLLETRQGPLVSAALSGLLMVSVLRNLLQLWRLTVR